MKILAIDTATEACSAALYQDGETIGRYQIAPREHSRLILKMVDELLTEAGCSLGSLDSIAFGRGPGSFMGIRIATGVVQGIAYAQDLPVVPVSDLKTIAEVAYRETGAEQVLSAIDARMGEVYWAGWLRDKQGRWQNIIDESVCAPEAVLFPKDGQWTGAGTGWNAYVDVLRSNSLIVDRSLPACLPSADAIATIAAYEYKLGNIVSAAQAQPVYLRNNVAKKPEQKTFAAHLNL